AQARVATAGRVCGICENGRLTPRGIAVRTREWQDDSNWRRLMRANARWWIGVSMVVVLARTAVGQAAPPIAQFVPPAPNPAHVFVLDSAHILSDSMVAMLQDSSRALQAATGADVAWVTLPTLGGRPVEEAALYIGLTWRIGSEGQAGDPLRNRGLVILYVPDKTTTAGPNFRIEVGNGL